MIIRELVLHNFGVYASTNKFEFQGKKPIVLIGGMNGRGKTTFLEAVLLALYGSNSFAYSESKYKTFGQYLKSFINVSDGTLETFIDLEFSIDSSRSEIYRIHREWSGDKKRIAEHISVYKDQEYNQFLTDNWMMFIENILPSGLSNFFFFDGEKIAELAVEETSNQMKESIKSLLGISVLDLLQSDLGRIINRTTKNQVSNVEAKEIELLRSQRDKAKENFEKIESELKGLNDKKEELQQELESARQDYVTNGGDIVAQRQELFQNRATMSSKIEALKEQLVLDAASELPFVLVKRLLRNIRENAEIEQDNKMLEVALDKMKKYSAEYKADATDKNAIMNFIEYVSGKNKNKNIDYSYNLSDASLFHLQMLLDEQLLDAKFSVKGRQDEMVDLQSKLDQIDSYLSVDIDEKVIAKIYKKIKVIEQKLIKLDVQITEKTDERHAANGELLSATSAFNKRVEGYLKRVELNDDSDRIVKYSHMANTIIDEYKIRLQKSKISIVADTMTLCYKKLANKKNLIDRIEMDPVTLDLKYLNVEGDEVNKASLSAGEKQLMVISLLWSLALCSKKKLPVIIDTPLSRLDSVHRVSLIKTYFPQASEQTIILSTDSEIDKNYYKIMKDNIGDQFTLVYNDLTKSTTIKKGYFLEANE